MAASFPIKDFPAIKGVFDKRYRLKAHFTQKIHKNE
ncbi:hypothetical protein [Shigella phage ESh36]|nr:hypothetical protein [Shigella phage ESh36]